MYTGKTLKQAERRMALQEGFQWLIETVCTMAIGIALVKLALLICQ